MNYPELFVLVMAAVIIGCIANAIMNVIVDLILIGIKRILKR